MQRDRQRERFTLTADIHTDRQRHSHSGRQTYKKTDRETDRQRDRQAELGDQMLTAVESVYPVRELSEKVCRLLIET